MRRQPFLHIGLVCLPALVSAANSSTANGTNATSVDLSVITYPFFKPLSQINGLLAVVEAAVADALTQVGATVGGLLPGNGDAQFFGQSPPVYPSPSADGSGNWTEAFSLARALVGQMTIEEKANITLGQSTTHGCSGFTGTVPRLGFPGLCLNDAESGIRGGVLVSGFPSQIHVGASWNRSLARERAVAIGREFKGKGVNVLLGPVAGPVGRTAKGGRNWEGFSNDPYLSGSLMGPTISGLQESIIACVKHLIANEQETNRRPFLLDTIPGLGQAAVSANLDDRTMHELYLWSFYDALEAGVGSVMCSYQRVNNSYACQNSKVMNGLLKTELNFSGFVMSDFGAVLTGIAANTAGLDMVMPTSSYLTPSKLAQAIQNGSFAESRLDDQATRILAAWYRFAQFSDPGMTDHASIDVSTPEGDAANFQSAVEGHVLVKNVNRALPLSKPAVLNLFGYDGVGGKNTSSQAPFLYDVGQANTQRYPDGRLFTPLDAAVLALAAEPDASGPSIALDGTMISGGGSGAVLPTYSIAPYDGFLEQAAVDGTTLYTDFSSQAPHVTAPDAPCFVFINAQSAESYDRNELADEYSDTLVKNVASQCPNTMVVIHNAGIRVVDSWISNPNVTAVIFAHLPGQFSGRALVEIVYGRQSPSGRLPYTVAKQESDYGSLLSPDQSSATFPQSDFTEGLEIDYKHFLAQNITPRFPFGYGLTYSSFSYSSLQIAYNSSASTASLPPDSTSSPSQGGHASLYDSLATVTCTVTNTGAVTAAEVAQLYLSIPGNGLPKMLRGFDKHLIEPGSSAEFSFPLRRRDLSIWDVVQQQWVLPSGPEGEAFGVMVGKDVLDIQLHGTLNFNS